jgi:hypothetical protein
MDSPKNIPAKLCYSHLGGKLGNLLLESFIEKGWLSKEKPGARHFFVTKKGTAGFRKLGIDVSKIEPES